MGKDLTGKEIGDWIHQRKDGSYCARFTNRFGKRKSLYNANLAELKHCLREEMRKDISQANAETEFTLDEWYEKWMETYKYQIRDNSKRHYAQVYDKHIKPVLGQKRLVQITNLDVAGLINKLDKEGYWYETKNKVRIILFDMFNRAMIDDFALKNPARSIKIERDEAKERRVLSQSEQTDFFDACKGTFYEELYTVAVLTGLRPGELCALRWQDINIKKRTITVSRTLLYQKLSGDTKKEFHIEPPKTASSARTVKFNERCEMALKSQFGKKSVVSMKASAKPLPGYEDLLFVTKFNTPINSQIFIDSITRIIGLINESRSDIEKFEPFSAHCFRHTYATRCFEAGVDSKVVQQQLGHATLKMTMDLYTHLFEDKKTTELDKFDAISEEVFENGDNLAQERYNSSLRPKIINF
jgi:Site-specific recombinase XerD